MSRSLPRVTLSGALLAAAALAGSLPFDPAVTVRVPLPFPARSIPRRGGRGTLSPAYARWKAEKAAQKAAHRRKKATRKRQREARRRNRGR